MGQAISEPFGHGARFRGPRRGLCCLHPSHHARRVSKLRPQIRRAVTLMQQRLNEAGIRLKVVPGADNHIVPDFVAGLKEGRLLTLADSTYVLVEPPHHLAPAPREDLFFDICIAGYVPVLTHLKDYPGSRVNMMSSKGSLAWVSGCKSRSVPYVAGSGGAHAIGSALVRRRIRPYSGDRCLTSRPPRSSRRPHRGRAARRSRGSRAFGCYKAPRRIDENFTGAFAKSAR